MSRTLLVLHGPNLNLLGSRKPEIYGTQNLDDMNEQIKHHAENCGFDVRIEQRNGEGELIDLLHQHACSGKCVGVIINPGAYTHYSYALRDALEAVEVPKIEVHLSNIHSRQESFRQTSVTAAQCTAVIAGLGANGYLLALSAMRDLVPQG